MALHHHQVSGCNMFPSDIKGSLLRFLRLCTIDARKLNPVPGITALCSSPYCCPWSGLQSKNAAARALEHTGGVANLHVLSRKSLSLLTQFQTSQVCGRTVVQQPDCFGTCSSAVCSLLCSSAISCRCIMACNTCAGNAQSQPWFFSSCLIRCNLITDALVVSCSV